MQTEIIILSISKIKSENMLNIDVFEYIEKIIAAEKSLYETYSSLCLAGEIKTEKNELCKICDQHKNRYNALYALMKEKYVR